MLLGVPDAKPDRTVKQFIAAALSTDEQQLPTDQALRLVQAAAAHHGREQHALDHEIWKHQTTAAAAPTHDPHPERLVALATAFAPPSGPIRYGCLDAFAPSFAGTGSLDESVGGQQAAAARQAALRADRS
ncbi:hypothetical protein GXW82_10895 [Streptacidiphilus sp. 4-A2]|nr:hypothetical protein [Streptacidiphilus sp. 4-A2]